MNVRRFDNEKINVVIKTIKNASHLSGFSNKYLGEEEIQKFKKLLSH